MKNEGIAFVTFLVLIAFLASVVTIFTLIVSYEYQDVTDRENREMAYQVARGGLNIWMGHFRADALPMRLQEIPSPPKSKQANSTGVWTVLGQMNVGNLDVPGGPGGGGGGDTVFYDAHTDAWGWASDITISGVKMSDTVYVPSFSRSSSDQDYGYFRIVRIQDESGLHPDNRHDDSALETANRVNINTATFKALVNIVMNPDPSSDPRTLTSSMAKSIMERRSATSIQSDPPSLKDENYRTGKPNPFESINEACDFLDHRHKNFNCATFARHARITSEGLFVVEILGGSLSDLGQHKDLTRLKALVDRREFVRGSGPVKIISLTL